MGHEQIIRNGLIIDDHFSFLDNPTILITGITHNTAPALEDRNHIVTEEVIKAKIEGIKIEDLFDVEVVIPLDQEILIYDNNKWVQTAITHVTTNSYSKIEADDRFLHNTGGTISNLTATTIYVSDYVIVDGSISSNSISTTGNITVDGTVDGVDIAAFETAYDIFTGTTYVNRILENISDVVFATAAEDKQLIQYNGTNWVNIDVVDLNIDAYTKSAADAKFVNKTGDTMTGTLKLNPISGNALETLGDVNIQGNLYVSGDTVTVNSTNMEISDNLFLLNSGETATGVTRGTAGFLVDRGGASAVTLIFRESDFTIRVGETPSSIKDNTIDTSHTVALATIYDKTELQSLIFQDELLNGHHILNTLSTVKKVGNDLKLVGCNIIMNGLETVDGIDISKFHDSFKYFTGTTYADRDFNDISNVIVAGASDTQLLQYNGTNWVNVDASSIATDGYTKTEADAKFVYKTGDTMDGDLIVPSLTATTSFNLGNYIVTEILDEDNMDSDSATALATQQSIKAYVDTHASSDGYTKSEADAKFLYTTGDTMTSGDLTITDLSGTSNRLVYVDDTGKLQESDKYIYKIVKSVAGAGTEIIDTITASTCKAVVWDYVIDDGTNMRAGTITAVWNGSSVDWNETSTPDIGDTSSLDFSVTIGGTIIELKTTITGSGNWNIDVNRQMIG